METPALEVVSIFGSSAIGKLPIETFKGIPNGLFDNCDQKALLPVGHREGKSFRICTWCMIRHNCVIELSPIIC